MCHITPGYLCCSLRPKTDLQQSRPFHSRETHSMRLNDWENYLQAIFVRRSKKKKSKKELRIGFVFVCAKFYHFWGCLICNLIWMVFHLFLHMEKSWVWAVQVSSQNYFFFSFLLFMSLYKYSFSFTLFIVLSQKKIYETVMCEIIIRSMVIRSLDAK